MSKNKQQQALKQAVEEELRVHYTDPKQLNQRLAQCSQGMLDGDFYWSWWQFGSDQVSLWTSYWQDIRPACCCCLCSSWP
jgi:hypothetical protein